MQKIFMERLVLDEVKMNKKLDYVDGKGQKQEKKETEAILTSNFEEFTAKISGQLESIQVKQKKAADAAKTRDIINNLSQQMNQKIDSGLADINEKLEKLQ